MMPPTRFVSWGLFSLLLARPSALRQSESFKSRNSPTAFTAQQDIINAASVLMRPVVPSKDKVSNYSFSRNVNVNQLSLEGSRQNELTADYDTHNNDYSRDKIKKLNVRDNISKASVLQKLDISKNVKNTERAKKVIEKCKVSGRRSNQVHSRSFPRNELSMDVVNAFKVAGEAEANKTSSVHIGEDVTICWIETTIIKEDPAFDPPKRLVIREFTISFENSAPIPEGHLECSKLDGEISPGDNEAVCNTSLNEVIDKDTTRSQLVNFTKDSRDGALNIRRYKTVKCATGFVVSKDIYEWPDKTDNPKKRVEIKVGPSMRNVRTGSEGEPPACTSKLDVTKSQEKLSSSTLPGCASGEHCDVSAACTDSNECNQSNILSSCEDDDCLANSSEEILLKATNIRNDTSDEITKPTAMGKLDKTAFNISRNIMKTARPFVGSTDRTPTDDAEPCSGDDCKEKSAVTVALELTTQKNKTCEEGSEACTCIGASCSFHSTGNSSSLEVENERTTTPSINASTQTTLNDTRCDSESLECSGLLETSLEQNETHTTPLAEIGRETSEYSTNYEKQTTLKSAQASTITSTELTAPTSVISNEISLTPTPPPCLASKAGDCETAIPTASELIEQSSLKTVSISSTKATPLVVNRTEPSDSESSFSCGEDSAENCQSAGLDNGSESEDDNATSETIFGLIDTALSSAPKKNENSTIPVDDAVTSTPIPTTGSRSPSTEASTELLQVIRNTTLPNKDSSSSMDSVTECVFNSQEGSSNCSEKQMVTTATRKPCDSSKDCATTEAMLNSTVSSMQVTNSTTIESGGESSCNDSSESCGRSSSATSSEICDDSLSSHECNGSKPESCETSMDSCSSESDNSIVLTNGTTTTTQPTAREVDNISTATDNVLTTAETRRSTTVSQVSGSNKGQHKLTLKIKVLLERINEKKEKEKLVQLEKHLLLNQKSEESRNHSLVWKIKSLNNSMNIETLKSIFNCTDLDNLTEEFSHLTEFKQKGVDTMNLEKTADVQKTVGSSLAKSAGKSKTEVQDNNEEGSKKILFRKKREISVLKGHGEVGKSITNQTKVQAIKENLPGFNEDFKKGLGNVLHRLTRELGGPGNSKPVEPSPSTILNILANPNIGKVHSRRRRRAIKRQDVVPVQETRFPINGEEIHRWSNERFLSAADGGRVRSLLEFKIMRDVSDDSRRSLSGS